MAIYEINELGLQQTITWNQLYEIVSKWVQYFESLGIQKGDIVAGVLPNNLMAIVGMLATTSLGAIWSSCSPDFGEDGICDRLEQIQPKCVISTTNYIYKGKTITISDRRQAIKTACTLSESGDILLIAGKGHETYQEINGKRFHFDDLEEVTQCFKRLKK